MPENLSQFKEDFRLNGEQQEAVSQDPSRPFLVIAGPGAGKTAVIAARCRYLIESAGIKPSEILVLTFTRAAARSTSMVRRVALPASACSGVSKR